MREAYDIQQNVRASHALPVVRTCNRTSVPFSEVYKSIFMMLFIGNKTGFDAEVGTQKSVRNWKFWLPSFSFSL